MTVKAWARRAIASGPLYPAMRRRAQARDAVLFLTYHTLGGDDDAIDAWTVLRRGDFVRQIQLLRRDYDIVSIDAAMTATHGADGGRPRVVLTFDDGHSGWHDHLLPIVEAERLPVTLYVATGHIASGRAYWFDRVMNLAQTRTPIDVDLSAHGLGRPRLGEGDPQARWLAISALLEAMKRLDEPARDDAVEALAGAVGGRTVASSGPLRPLTVAQLQRIATSPFVTMGAHSDDHRLLDRIALEDARASIATSLDRLEAWTGRRPRHFAFPNGNFNAALMGVCRELGLASAATTLAGVFRPGDDPHAVPRVSIGRDDDLARFKLALVRV